MNILQILCSSVYIYVTCVYLYLCICLCMCVCVHMRVSVCVCARVCVCVCTCVCMCLRDTFHLIERGVLNGCFNVTAIFITPYVIEVMNALLCSTNTTIKVLLQCTFTLVCMWQDMGTSLACVSEYYTSDQAKSFELREFT